METLAVLLDLAAGPGVGVRETGFDFGLDLGAERRSETRVPAELGCCFGAGLAGFDDDGARGGGRFALMGGVGVPEM